VFEDPSGACEDNFRSERNVPVHPATPRQQFKLFPLIGRDDKWQLWPSRFPIHTVDHTADHFSSFF
jgi:hypothetical protein